MKTLLLSLSFALNISAAVAGPSTSGGIAYEVNYEQCLNIEQGTDLRIMAVGFPDSFFGFLVEDQNNFNTLKCVEGKNGRSPMTGEEIVWKCTEERPGEGQIQIHINRNNNGLKYGILYRKNIIQKLQPMYTLDCNPLVSNK